MKKFLLFLTLFLSAVGLAQAEEKSYTIEFKGSGTSTENTSITTSTQLTNIINSGTDYVSAITEVTGNVYIAKETNGIKVGKSGGAGTISFSISEKGKVKATKVVVNAATYNSNKQGTLSVYLNGNSTADLSQKLTATTFSDLTITLSSPTELSSIKLGADQYLHVKSITVYYDDGTSGGDEPTLTDPAIAWKLNEKALAEGAAVSATLGSESNVLPTLSFAEGATITCDSSNKSVATVANDGTVTIIAAGTTTITASTPADDATFKQSSKSYTLTVIDPNDQKIEFNFADIFGTSADVSFSNGTKEVNGASITCKDGSTATKYYKSDKTLRLYTDGTITVAAPKGYYVTKIVFTAADWSISCDATNGTLTDKTWIYTAGEPTSNAVTFKATAKTFFKTITVYYKSALADDDAGLAFESETDNATYGTTYTVQALTNPKSVEVSWTSSATDVAEFVDGALSIKKAGTTTITATATDSKYTTNNTASYTLTIDKGDPAMSFAESTVNKILGEANFTNTITKPEGVAVTYTTDPAESEVASVDANTGEVTILAAGTVTIVATSAETETYKAGSASYTLTVADKYEAGLAYTPAEVTLAQGEALTQPTLANPNDLFVSYSSDNTDVATVNATTGVITLAGGLGTAVITASTEGDATHKAGSATFTITVKKAQVAYLVTDASTLQPGDQIIIASYGTTSKGVTWNKAISTSNANADYRNETDVTFNSDFSELASIPDDVLLIELEQTVYNETNYWLFKTLNYSGTNGYLGNTALSSNNLRVIQNGNTDTDCYATIASNDDNTVKVLFNLGSDPSNSNSNGASYNKNYLQYNQTYNRFSCYGVEQTNGQVYIYKVVDKPATVGTQTSDFTFATKGEKENFNVIELENMFTTSTAYNKVAVYMENILVGTYTVDASGNVDASFDYIPYLPTAKFTMRPVLATDSEGNPTQFGPSEALEFTWPALNNDDTFGFGLADEAIYCVNEKDEDGPWQLYGQFTFLDDFKKDNLDYSVEVEAYVNDGGVEKLESEFAWGNGGFIVTLPYFFVSESWDKNTGHPDITDCEVPQVKFILTPSYEFTYDTKYSSLVTGSAAAPARFKAPGETATQTITSASQELVSTLDNETAVSGVEGVTVDADSAVEYFNLQGVRVDGDLAPGIYIRRQGQKVSKIQIK